MRFSEGVKIFTFEKFKPQVQIIREFYTYPENYKSLAIIVRAGHRQRRSTKRKKERHISTRRLCNSQLSNLLNSRYSPKRPNASSGGKSKSCS